MAQKNQQKLKEKKKQPTQKEKVQTVLRIHKSENRKLLNIGFIVVSVFLFLFSGYHFYFAKKIVPGVTVGSVKIGGLSQQEAYDLLFETYGGQDFEMILDGELKNVTETYTLNFAQDLGLSYDWEQTVIKAFSVGRSSNPINNAKDKLKGLLLPLRVNADYTYNEDLLNTEKAKIKAEFSDPGIDAEFVIDDMGNFVLKPSYSGKIISTDYLYKILIASFDEVDVSTKRLVIERDEPELTETDLAKIKDEVQTLVFSDLSVVNNASATELSKSAGEKSQVETLKTLTPQEKLNLIKLEKDAFGNLDVDLDDAHFEALLKELELKINRTPKGLVTEEGADGMVLVFEIKEKGVILDRKPFTEDFKDAFFEIQPKVEVTTKETGVPEDAKKYGIFALLGTGTSHFYGSSSGRINNLTLAAERTSGVLVAPGEIYSMNDSVGEISSATGYDSAYIIYEGRTILGAGGGVCQTSTTLFRAILDAGLPVVERAPHAYRVRYYEYDKPVGFDASVFQPFLDLKFRNDTPNYVLVQSSADLDESLLTFKIYGTPDGREVEISEPVITSVTAPPDPVYKDEPTLAKGVTKQIEWPSWGSNVYFTRKVTRGDEVLYEDVFKSHYQPWGAVFLVGTK